MDILKARLIQKKNNLRIGEALVKIGAINEAQLIEELKQFNKLSLQGRIL